MQTANKLLSNDSLYASVNQHTILKRIYRFIIELGSVGTFLSITFLWVFTYLGYYTLTGMSLSVVVASTSSNKLYLFLGFFFYILHWVSILAYVDTKEICKKYKVTVIN